MLLHETFCSPYVFWDTLNPPGGPTEDGNVMQRQMDAQWSLNWGHWSQIYLYRTFRQQDSSKNALHDKNTIEWGNENGYYSEK